jgi:uncharacterized protein YkwD/uncharacterized membrane protein required for colicin V production
MNYISLLLLIIIIGCVWTSVQRGFILSSLILLTWLGSLAAGFWGYKPMALLLHKLLPALNYWASPLAFVIVVIIARIVIDELSEHVIADTTYRTHASIINRVFGIVPGLINGYVSAALLAALLMLLPLSNKISDEAAESNLAQHLVARVSWFNGLLSPIIGDALAHNATAPGAEPGSEGTVKLHFTVKHPVARPDLELKMLYLINDERRRRGLDTLQYDPEMTTVARRHSADMFARSYFSHYTPEGLSPFDRMQKEGIHFIAAGENVAIAPTLSIAHKGLMNSPGHRDNILNRAFHRVGIGIMDGSIYGMMVTQDFRN